MNSCLNEVVVELDMLLLLICAMGVRDSMSYSCLVCCCYV